MKVIQYSTNKYGENIPAELKEEAEMALEELKSRVADVDDELAELYLMEEPIDTPTLKAAIRRATIANKFIPVAGGSVFKADLIPASALCKHVHLGSLCNGAKKLVIGTGATTHIYKLVTVAYLTLLNGGWGSNGSGGSGLCRR